MVRPATLTDPGAVSGSATAVLTISATVIIAVTMSLRALFRILSALVGVGRQRAPLRRSASVVCEVAAH